jgi:RNA polymerase sigma-70 factor (ECF subfamily)
MLTDKLDEDSLQAGAATAARLAADEARLRELVARLLRHDQQALAALYEKLIGRVYGLALRIARNPALAEEIAADVFWQVWRQAPRYAPERGAVTAWVLTIARSRALDALRKQAPLATQVDVESLSPDEGGGLDDGGGDGGDPQDLVAAVQSHRQLRQALAGLDALPRQLLAMAFFRGLTHEEIAEQACMPLGTVKSHLRRSMERLRQVMQGNDGRPEAGQPTNHSSGKQGSTS